MNKSILIPIAFFSFLLLSCNERYVNETKDFNKYLTDNYQEKIPINEHIYLLICTFNCSGCVQKTLLKISGKVKNNKCHSITILTYDLNKIPYSLKSKVNVLFDKNAQYENIGLSVANIALVKTNKRKIVTIQIINFDKIDKIVNSNFSY